MASPTRSPYKPRIRLFWNDGVRFYDFNPLANTSDFKASYLECKPVYDGVSGAFTMKITSQNASNSAMNTILSNVGVACEVLISVGKTNSSLIDVYRGVIERVSISEENPNSMQVKLEGRDWGSVLLKGLITNGAATQRKGGNGVDLDPTDPDTKAAQLYQTLCTNPAWYPAGADGINAQSLGLVVNAANITVASVNLPQLYSNMEFLDDKLTEIDNFVYAYHYVDPAKNLIVKTIGQDVVSTVPLQLFTDDYNDPLAQSQFSPSTGALWSFIANTSEFIDSIEDHKARIFGLGGDLLTIDQKQQTTSGGSANNGTLWQAQKFTPLVNELETVAIYIGKIGLPVASVSVEIIEDVNGSPQGGESLGLATLDPSSIGADGWFNFTFSTPLNSAKSYWIVLQTVSNAGNCFKWYKDGGSTGSTATSSDGIAWTVTNSTSSFAYITYYTRPLMQIYPVGTLTTQTRHFVEEVIRKQDITQSALLQLLIQNEATYATLKKQMLNFDIFVPDVPPTIGQTIRVNKTKTGRVIQTDGSVANPDFILGNIEYVFDGETEESQDGLLFLKTTLTRFLPFS